MLSNPAAAWHNPVLRTMTGSSRQFGTRLLSSLVSDFSIGLKSMWPMRNRRQQRRCRPQRQAASRSPISGRCSTPFSSCSLPAANGGHFLNVVRLSAPTGEECRITGNINDINSLSMSINYDSNSDFRCYENARGGMTGVAGLALTMRCQGCRFRDFPFSGGADELRGRGGDAIRLF